MRYKVINMAYDSSDLCPSCVIAKIELKELDADTKVLDVDKDRIIEIEDINTYIGSYFNYFSPTLILRKIIKDKQSKVITLCYSSKVLYKANVFDEFGFVSDEYKVIG